MTQAQPTTRGGRYTNTALTAIAVLLALNLLKPVDFVAAASAQPASEGLASAAEQRKQIIAELASIEKKIERVEAQMTKGIRISEMPELKLPAEMKEALRAAARTDKGDKGDKPVGAPAPAR